MRSSYNTEMKFLLTIIIYCSHRDQTTASKWNFHYLNRVLLLDYSKKLKLVNPPSFEAKLARAIPCFTAKQPLPLERSKLTTRANHTQIKTHHLTLILISKLTSKKSNLKNNYLSFSIISQSLTHQTFFVFFILWTSQIFHTVQQPKRAVILQSSNDWKIIMRKIIFSKSKSCKLSFHFAFHWRLKLNVIHVNMKTTVISHSKEVIIFMFTNINIFFFLVFFFFCFFFTHHFFTKFSNPVFLFSSLLWSLIVVFHDY